MVGFSNRTAAGRTLADMLASVPRSDLVVVGLPRGGVPVAFEVAHALGAPLDVILVRKLGLPAQPELAMGAIGEGGVRVLNPTVLETSAVTGQELAAVEARERAVLEKRARMLRGDAPPLPLAGRTVIVVDDGVATGATARAACQVVRAKGARRVILAVPVAPPRWTESLGGVADDYVAASTPEGFDAVGRFYADFSPVSDETVAECLHRARLTSATVTESEVERTLVLPAGQFRACLQVPSGPPAAMVVMIHGSGSHWRSPRNRPVSERLVDAGFATLRFDRVADDERSEPSLEDAAHRLLEVTEWVRHQPEFDALPIFYFGASSGAAVALWAAAEPGNSIAGVISRGGRGDLVGYRVADVTAPTLLIVGDRDREILRLNRLVQARLRCLHTFELVPGASHLFAEAGTLEAVADLTVQWCRQHLGVAGTGVPSASPRVTNR